MPANLAALAQRYGINTVVGEINKDVQGEGDFSSFQKELYYDQYMLDKIKIDSSNYVFLQYAKSYQIPKGHGIWTIRRNFPLTEHTVPLLEGIPPRSDKMRKERIEGTYHQYGRYMEFADRIDWKLLDPVVMEYADEYGDVATRTMHRLARKELLNSTMKVYAHDKASIGELEIGDTVGLADFRLVALKLSRLAVRPIGGSFPVITSEEHFYDLMKVPLIKEYLGSINGMPHFKTGELPELFNIKFRKTQLDDYAYGYELSNTGEYLEVDNNGQEVVKNRLYIIDPKTNEYRYVNVNAADYRKIYAASEYREESSFAGVTTGGDNYPSRAMEEGLDDMSGAEAANEVQNRLADGSWIPIRTVWHIDSNAAKIMGMKESDEITTALTSNATGTSLFTTVFGEEVTYDFNNTDTLFTLYWDGVEIGTLVKEDKKLTKADVNGLLPKLKQLPVHKAIMLGEDALAKLEVPEEGNVEMHVKEKGSAGVLDPINQRQSIGFKINAVGFELVRDEACWVFHHVPTHATATAGISL